jgi:RNA polymerase sigma factor (sigma-70 family)
MRQAERARQPPQAAVTVLYDMHYRGLTQLAALLVSDLARAEEIVQDAFVAMHGSWLHLGVSDSALPYLRREVVRRSRSSRAARLDRPGRPPLAPEGGISAPARAESGLVAALRGLPARQREALVLRYFADLPETQIAAAMGISARMAHIHLARGMSSLMAVLERGHPAAGQCVNAGEAGQA